MIVSSRVYRPGCAGEEVEVDDISEVIKEPEAFIWLGLWQPDAEFMAKIKEEFGLHELAVEERMHSMPISDLKLNIMANRCLSW